MQSERARFHERAIVWHHGADRIELGEGDVSAVARIDIEHTESRDHPSDDANVRGRLGGPPRSDLIGGRPSRLQPLPLIEAWVLSWSRAGRAFPTGAAPARRQVQRHHGAAMLEVVERGVHHGAAGHAHAADLGAMGQPVRPVRIHSQQAWSATPRQITTSHGPAAPQPGHTWRCSSALIESLLPWSAPAGLAGEPPPWWAQALMCWISC